MDDKNLGYFLMRKNDPITYAEFTPNGELISYSKKIINKELAPLQDMYQNNWLNLWWKERVIPIKQNNLANFLKENGYSIPSEYLIKNLGLSLTDYYWIKPVDSELTWENINLFDNEFKENLLVWDKNDNESETPSYSPNSSLQGTIEKTWIINDGERFLIKGNHNESSAESINEVIACEIHKNQGFNNYTDYGLVHINGKDYDYGCYSKLFTSQQIELVSAFALYTNEKKQNNASHFSHLLKMCEKFGMNKEEIQAGLDYQILTDFIMSGHDRHLNNIAFLRDANTLKFLGLAPIFDSGSSFFAGKVIPKNEKDLLNITTSSFVKKETKLLNYVQDRDAVDLTKLPPASYIQEMYQMDSKMHEKDINNIAYWYERKIDVCRDFQLGKDVSSRDCQISVHIPLEIVESGYDEEFDYNNDNFEPGED